MLQRITLHLARTPSHTEGDSRDGYEIAAPLTDDGRLDAEQWRLERDRCRVRRFRPGKPDRHGWLLHRAGGDGGATWLIDYDNSRRDDDEGTFKLDRHRIAVGEYISVRGDDGDFVPFRVASIRKIGTVSLALSGRS
ncbi:hypothetical protein J2Y55_001374 [Bosea sp. BE125]|uniref:hypothetical protein n=1 Tax=Bosea sp. BE125 TaxID=2817909 RepID=UPI002860BC8B|nr:hypothetical protein [Bosea sp. BE125]MDR6870374.1 hypothetical protein [Bosea sp. BE125]